MTSISGRLDTTRVIAGLWVGLVVLAAVATALARPRWWTWIAPEASLAREVNTVMLLATSGLTLVIRRRRPPAEGSAGGWQAWSVGERYTLAALALGFFGLAVDERVAIHERLRDRVLAPRGIGLPFIPWGEPGDIVLVVVAIIGLAFLRPVLRVVGQDRRALRWFLGGVVLAAVAVGLDTLPIESYPLRYEIYFQSGEEAIELMAAACFLSSMLCLNEGLGAPTATTDDNARDQAREQRRPGSREQGRPGSREGGLHRQDPLPARVSADTTQLRRRLHRQRSR